MYRLSEKDIHKLITACKSHRENTSSIYIFDEYTELIKKLKTYLEQNTETVSNVTE